MLFWGIALLIVGLIVWACAHGGVFPPPAGTIGAVVAVVGLILLLLGLLLPALHPADADYDASGDGVVTAA